MVPAQVWRGLLVGAVVTVVLSASAFVGGVVVEARRGLGPAGPGCDYEVDHGSGTAGEGVERIEWTPLPERRCLAATGPGIGRSWPRPFGEERELGWWAALVLGGPLALGGAAGVLVVLLAQRPRRSGGVGAPA